MRRILLAAASLVPLGGALHAQTAQPGDWPSYGRDAAATHYSPLAQITPANVGSLKVAWTWHMRDGLTGARALASEATPLVIGGTLYLSTPQGRIAALDGATGKEVWTYTIPDNARPSARGMEYWAGEKGQDPELIFGTSDGKLRALSTKTGQPVAGFGDNGAVNLRTPEV